MYFSHDFNLLLLAFRLKDVEPSHQHNQYQSMHLWSSVSVLMWVRSWRCDCLVTWFCYHLIAKPGNKTVAPSWPDPYWLTNMDWKSDIVVHSKLSTISHYKIIYIYICVCVNKNMFVAKQRVNENKSYFVASLLMCIHMIFLSYLW